MKGIFLSRWHLPKLLLAMVAGALFCSAVPLMAAPPAETPGEAGQAIDAREQLRQQTRERVLQQQNAPQVNEHLPRPDRRLPGYPANEQPCFTINRIALTGDSASRFQWALDAAADATGRCLGGQGIVLVINKVQNAILAKGYVTTRVMAQEQDLTRGVLTLTLQPGRISQIRFDEPVSWRGRLWNAIPASSGDILNLRDIEQGLENFKRVPSASADIKIVPGEQEATSDLQVNWHEGRPVRLSVGLDDSGSKSTGRYLGSATLAVDAPFAQNDLFYASIGKNLFEHGPFGNRSHTLNYFFPIGYWAVSANYNDYTYHQNIPNANEVLRYSGKSDNFQLTVSRLLYRDQSNKTTLNLRGYRKHSTNAVNDIDIEQQKRRTAGWELGLNQHSYLGNSTLDANIAWRRGTGAFNALPAPEESRHQGSARTGILLGDLGINHPFAVGEQPWRVYSSVRGQWSPNALTPQERMAIAGRYTVRGFDGEQMLSGEKGLLWRNEIGWNLFSRGHELYLAADYGRVTQYAMDVLGVDRQTAQGYAETKQGMEIVVASVTPVLGSAAAKQLSKIVDANLKVVAKGDVDGAKFSDTNQGSRPSQLADFNKPTLINDVVQAKIDKRPGKNLPNGNMGTAHAEIGVIQQAYDKGMTNGKDMLMSVSGENVCSYCTSDLVKMAAKSGLKSLTIYEEKSGDVLFWEKGMRKFTRK